MFSICPYLHVHQPHRLKPYRVFDIGFDREYFNHGGDDDLNNEKVLNKVAEKSYLPTNRTLQHLLDQHPEFRFALSFSGVVIEQMEQFRPDVLDSFKQLVDSGRVELMADTYFHSLAFFYDEREFEEQVHMHREKMEAVFGQTPQVMRNTELSYNNDLAQWADRNGYIGILAEGWDPILGWRSPNFVYQPPETDNIRVLLKNYRLSDDIAFRFSEHSWEGWPLDAEKFADWVSSHHGNAHTINLFMDYETFGEHQWEETGIFDFLTNMPGAVMRDGAISFKTPSETITSYEVMDTIDVPEILTWADTERDLTAWVGNEIQQAAIGQLYALERTVLATRDPQLIHDWRKLQTSDHFYYMCTKYFADGDVHAYFNPYESPYDAYIAFMNALHDLQLRIEECEVKETMKDRFLRYIEMLRKRPHDPITQS
jgi:alpha-amylase